MQILDYVISPIRNQYDYILIDSHPEVSDVLRSIIYASDFCVSPVKLDRQSSIGVATIIGEINNVNADVEMLRGSITNVDYEDTQFVGSLGRMASEWGGELKQYEQTGFNSLAQTGGGLKHYVTEGGGLRKTTN